MRGHALATASRVLLFAVPVTLLAACSGGAGSLGGGDFGYDSATASGDRRPDQTESPTTNTERPTTSGGGGASGGGSGAGGFTCSGFYICSATVQGQTIRIPIVLSNANGCQALGREPGENVTLTSDGTLVEDGRVVGSWSASGGNLVVTSDGNTLTCVPTSERGLDGSNEQPQPSSGGASG